MRRCKKVLNTSFAFYLLLSISFGIFGYFCLGEKFTNDLFMLRTPFSGKQHESAYQLIIMFFGFFLLLYIGFFNLSINILLERILKERYNRFVVSFSLITICAFFCAFYPNIINFLGYNGIISCIPNGLIYPLLIKYKSLKGSQILKKTTLIFTTAVILGMSMVSLYHLIKKDLEN